MPAIGSSATVEALTRIYTYCRGCIYFHATPRGIPYCNYFESTGSERPSAGIAECNEYTIFIKKGCVMSKIDSELRKLIFQLIEEGKNSSEIAAMLGIGEYTVRLVKGHITRAEREPKPPTDEMPQSRRDIPVETSGPSLATTRPNLDGTFPVGATYSGYITDNKVAGPNTPAAPCDPPSTPARSEPEKMAPAGPPPEAACAADCTVTRNDTIKSLMELCLRVADEIGADIENISVEGSACFITGKRGDMDVYLRIERKSGHA